MMMAAIPAPNEPRRATGFAAQPRSVLFLIDQLTELGGAERMMFTLARSLSLRGYRVSIVTLRDNPSPEAYKLADEIIVLPMRSCLSRDAFQCMHALVELIRLRDVTLVQTYFESADIFGAVVSWIAGVQAVCSSRRDMGILRSRKHRLLYRILTHCYSHIFAVSEQVAHWHQRTDRIPRDKLSVIHNGVAIERYQRETDLTSVRSAFGIPND